MNDNHFKFSNTVIALPLFFVLLLWFIYWLQIRFDFDFYQYGIYPRDFSGLKGVLFSPFIHENLGHLYNNSIPLLVLLPALHYFYPKQSLPVIVYGILFSGLITWVIGRTNYHIGASGLIYVLVSFIFFKGIQTRYYRLVALSFSVILLYGGMIWYVFPEVDANISWEGHLAGFLTGFTLTLFYKTPEYAKPIVYDWQKPEFDPEQDAFMKHFDEKGNFVNAELPEEEPENYVTYFSSDPWVKYTITKSDSEENK
ncbi:rhomboid family intramembrane serine protease [Flavobacterium sp. Fl-77]|uniref:Rhomboid family intramembrane serine protease n=1 Tax=Flavobacterium flavipigmentatum TaxID=2893884 RepID=A0AAJ2S7E6_9FLAO|nr:MULTISPECIES: rhomboid family intramembrane serine protease [unclassified Flavobacterium]MDX6182144.1 rhomboid family intramembrane serine protease [Flavobacterium sp. Fl-33]MDX6185943.1 rhomboid family intramembrane serine protease [Flavobacterium sp. Fl-77]UFH39119.1 rhomboid family intramembrane serine protease [Flavobacterium sp. F-70]